MRFERLQAALNFFRVALPHRYLHTGLQPEKRSGIFPAMTVNAHDSQKWHDSLNRKWMRSLNVGAAKTTLTHEDSEWSRSFEEP